MNLKKNIISITAFALSFSLAACNKGSQTTSQSTSSSIQEQTILDKLETQVEGGNAYMHVENFANITFIDNDTYFEEYLGEYVDYYYNSGLAYVDGVGYCSFTQLEDEMGEKLDGYKLSDIQLPCNEKFDFSDIMYTLKLLVSYDADTATIENNIATITDETYALNVANFIGVDYSYFEYIENITIKEITDGYEFQLNYDTTESEEPLDPIESIFQVTDFGKAKHEAFENYLKDYTATGLTEGFGEYEEYLDECTEPKMEEYLKNTFQWSISSVCTYSWRAGLYIYDYGCGDKLEQMKEDIIGLGYEYMEDYSYEGCYDFLIETKAVTDESVEYVSGRYEVVVSYDSNEAMSEMYGYPENVFPEGAITISFNYETFEEPGAMEKAMKNINYYPGKTCPSFSFDDIEYTNSSYDDYGRFDTYLEFTFNLESKEDATTLFDRYIAAYDADDMFTKGDENRNTEEGFSLSCDYNFEEYDGEDLVYYCYVNFYLEIDESFYGDDSVYCTYSVNYNYIAE